MIATDSCTRSFVTWHRRASMPIQMWSSRFVAVNSTALEGDHSSGGSPTSLSVGARKLNLPFEGRVETSPGTGNPVIHPSLERRRIPVAHNITWNLKDRKSTRLNSSHLGISYAVFCL